MLSRVSASVTLPAILLPWVLQRNAAFLRKLKFFWGAFLHSWSSLVCTCADGVFAGLFRLKDKSL